MSDLGPAGPRQTRNIRMLGRKNHDWRMSRRRGGIITPFESLCSGKQLSRDEKYGHDEKVKLKSITKECIYIRCDDDKDRPMGIDPDVSGMQSDGCLTAGYSNLVVIHQRIPGQ